MCYTKNDHITSVKDVEHFFDHLLMERKVNFHPDDRFEDYINLETKESSFTTDECNLYNDLMEESFNVCEKMGIDIYGLGTDKLFALLKIK